MDRVQSATDALYGVWGLVDDETKTEALNGGWYRESRRVARKLSKKHGTSLATAAGVIAALSPRMRWNANVAGADAILGGSDEGPGFSSNVAKAVRIRNGEKPLAVLGGDKVRAFYRAIMGDKDAAVVDVWMYRAMGVLPEEMSYADAEEALRAAAEKAGVAVADFQAIVWTQARGGAD